MTGVRPNGSDADWHISSYSSSTSGDCVEAGPLTDGSARFAVRDSRHRDLGCLTFTAPEWAAFLAGVAVEDS
ncbi:hypothetical protein GCM10009799_10200 [Nocardiopsis rhodophaea]|uniref:DUF397 domain-containing protein n=1 Tax=Nocardiopsis rhodophaea TaxID=280238 RepID=A0ABN2SH48_9ACTN